MTLQPYTPERLDVFALRMLDMAALFRDLAQNAREHGIQSLTLHDRKALDWCGKLESWAQKCRGEMEIQIHGAKASRRAKAFLHS